MPRPDKQINSRGPLDAPTSSSRAETWTKHGGPETAEGFRGAPTSIEMTVDDLTVVDDREMVDTAPSKWEQRGTAAHMPMPESAPADVRRIITEWVVQREIDGRTYRRTDALTVVDDPA